MIYIYICTTKVTKGFQFQVTSLGPTVNLALRPPMAWEPRSKRRSWDASRLAQRKRLETTTGPTNHQKPCFFLAKLLFLFMVLRAPGIDCKNIPGPSEHLGVLRTPREGGQHIVPISDTIILYSFFDSFAVTLALQVCIQWSSNLPETCQSISAGVIY